MEIKLMRRIDYYVGVPMCILLAGCKILLSFFQRECREPPEKILLIKFLGIGSIILTAPAVAAIRVQYPQAKVYYLTFFKNREIVELLEIADRIFFIETESFYRFFVSTCQTVVTLWRERIDLAFDFEFFAKFPLVLAVVSRVRKIAGFYLISEIWRKNLLDFYGYYNHYFHVKDIFLSLVYLVAEEDPYYERFGKFRKRYGFKLIKPSSRATEVINKRLSEFGITEDRTIILVNPNAGEELAPQLKRWPVKMCAEFVTNLQESVRDAYIVFTGSPSEKAYVQLILGRLPKEKANSSRLINLAGMTTLSELSALCVRASVLVTVDSGTMHLAALTRTPTVALFGAETPRLYAPLNDRAKVLTSTLYSTPMFTIYTGKKSMLHRPVPLESLPLRDILRETLAYLTSPS